VAGVKVKMARKGRYEIVNHINLQGCHFLPVLTRGEAGRGDGLNAVGMTIRTGVTEKNPVEVFMDLHLRYLCYLLILYVVSTLFLPYLEIRSKIRVKSRLLSFSKDFASGGSIHFFRWSSGFGKFTK
jgi:hypothetical protein